MGAEHPLSAFHPFRRIDISDTWQTRYFGYVSYYHLLLSCVAGWLPRYNNEIIAASFRSGSAKHPANLLLMPQILTNQLH